MADRPKEYETGSPQFEKQIGRKAERKLRALERNTPYSLVWIGDVRPGGLVRGRACSYGHRSGDMAGPPLAGPGLVDADLVDHRCGAGLRQRLVLGETREPS